MKVMVIVKANKDSENGVMPGERVVTRGAYDIKLAASGGAVPEHGHAH